MTAEIQAPDSRFPSSPERRPPSRTSRIVRIVLVLIVVSAVIGGLIQFNEFRKGMIAKFLAGNVPPPVPGAVVEAKLGTVERSLDAIGTLQAVRQVTVSPEVAGRVVRIQFESGSYVKAGDALVQLNDETEQASLLAYRAQSKLAELNFERALDLRRNNAGPQTTVDTTRAQVDAANADIRRTEALIGQKLIKAPFEGNLGIRKINLGEFVTAGASIVTLTDLSKLHVNFTLPEQSGGQVRVGQEIRLVVDAYPSRVFLGTVTTIDPQVAAETRSLRVQGLVDNAEHVLLPGSYANVKIILPSETNVVVLPATTIDYSLYGDSVYVVKEETDKDGKAKQTATRVPVKTGPRSGNNVLIREGVELGQRVIVSGQIKLSNGTAVTITDDNRLKQPDKLPVY